MARTSLEKQLRRAERQTTRAAGRVSVSAKRDDLLAGFAPDAEERATDRAEALRVRATRTNNVRQAVRLNSRAAEIESALKSDAYTRPGGSPRVAALRELARISRAGARSAAAPERLASANVRRGEVIREAVRGRAGNSRSNTGLGLNLSPEKRAELRADANSGSLQNFLGTLRAGQLRRFEALRRMDSTRGTIARSFLAADENARRQATSVTEPSTFDERFSGLAPQRSAPFPVTPQRSTPFPAVP